MAVSVATLASRAMKNFLQGLLIFVSLCLCALIAFQWVRETRQQKDLQVQADKIHDKMEAIQNLELQGKRFEAEIQRLDGLKNDMAGTIKTNKVEIEKLNKDLLKVEASLANSEKQAEAYKGALQNANESIALQNESVKRQNEEMKKLAEDRNEIVKKLNKMAADYNDLVTKWNKVQEDLAAQATNAPAPAKK
jgi:chromosome segregation ATPase